MTAPVFPMPDELPMEHWWHDVGQHLHPEATEVDVPWLVRTAADVAEQPQVQDALRHGSEAFIDEYCALLNHDIDAAIRAGQLDELGFLATDGELRDDAVANACLVALDLMNQAIADAATAAAYEILTRTQGEAA